jgi:hypothetical protein
MALLQRYARVLRAIGQALEKEEIPCFELRCDDGDEFILQHTEAAAPFLSLVERRFSLVDLRALDLQGVAKRSDGFKAVDFYGLPETLRAIGQYVDSQSGRLKRIHTGTASSVSGSMEIEYLTRDGRSHKEDLPVSSTYEFAMRMYRERNGQGSMRIPGEADRTENYRSTRSDQSPRRT